jgi:predicted O-methyltransferase YrrM
MTEGLKNILREVISKGKVIEAEDNTPVLSIDMIHLDSFKDKYKVDFLSILDTLSVEEQNNFLNSCK